MNPKHAKIKELVAERGANVTAKDVCEKLGYNMKDLKIILKKNRFSVKRYLEYIVDKFQ